MRRRNAHFGLALSGAVSDVEFAVAEGEAFVGGLVSCGLEHFRGGAMVEKDGHGLVAGGVGPGVVAEHGGDLVGAADVDADGLAGEGGEAGFQAGLHLGSGGGGVEDGIAAGDEGAHVGVAGLLAQADQVLHGEQCGAEDVYASQEGDVGMHGGSLPFYRA